MEQNEGRPHVDKCVAVHYKYPRILLDSQSVSAIIMILPISQFISFTVDFTCLRRYSLAVKGRADTQIASGKAI